MCHTMQAAAQGEIRCFLARLLKIFNTVTTQIVPKHFLSIDVIQIKSIYFLKAYFILVQKEQIK